MAVNLVIQAPKIAYRASSSNHPILRHSMTVTASLIKQFRLLVNSRAIRREAPARLPPYPYLIASRQVQTMPETRSVQPLVWIDCEMTGLDATRDKIISIACLITTHDLKPISNAPIFNRVLHFPASEHDMLLPVVQKMHQKSGLLLQCSQSTLTAESVSAELLDYIKSSVPEPRRALLAGNSVHADAMFLRCEPWKKVIDWLHYRIFDVSTIKEAARRWAGDEQLERIPVKKKAHMADDDIVESLEEAKFYMTVFFSNR